MSHLQYAVGLACQLQQQGVVSVRGASEAELPMRICPLARQHVRFIHVRNWQDGLRQPGQQRAWSGVMAGSVGTRCLTDAGQSPR